VNLKIIVFGCKVVNKMSPNKTADAGDQYFFHGFPEILVSRTRCTNTEKIPVGLVHGTIYVRFLFEMNIFLIYGYSYFGAANAFQ
jgi:hypothetical protein